MSDERREQIIAVAQRHFAWYGYRKARLENISQELNLTKAALYNYFSNKKELFATVVEREIQEYLRRLDEAIAGESGPVDKLRVFFVEMNKLIQESISLYDITRGTMQELGKVALGLRASHFEEMQKLLQGILQGGIEAGIFEIEAPNAIAESMLIGFHHFTEHWLFREGNLKSIEMMNILINAFLFGIVKRVS
ncbi:TetR/AcrR family transcriptional regulator [bacterium]|nr:TetR/AcrR family transcriptional regulator [bacterium]